MNNYTTTEVKLIRETMEKDAVYGVFGFEKAPTTGTPHLQGYIRFKSPRHPTALHKLKGFSRATFLYCEKSEIANVRYCKKVDTKDPDMPNPWEEFHPENLDAPDAAPNKVKLREVCVSVREGGMSAIEQLIRDQPEFYVRHHRGLLALAHACLPRRQMADPPTCVYAYGDPGSGKSTFIHKLAEEEAAASGRSIWYWGAEFPWGDGYDGSEIVVIDDFRDKDFKGVPIPINFITRVIDKFELKIQTKGGHCQMNGKSFYLSSVMHPGDLFGASTVDPVAQFLRRITSLYHCVKKDDGSFEQKLLGTGLAPRASTIGTFAMP